MTSNEGEELTRLGCLSNWVGCLPNFVGHPNYNDTDVFVDDEDENLSEAWRPTGNVFRDFWYFCGPGWMVSIAYVDPGNYQADIQAGATSRYQLLWAVWWSSSLYLPVS